jgi:predicted RNase H-like HicB family nuclease
VELTLVIHRQAAGYWSEVRELPGCFASARTLAELREAVEEAVGLYLWDRPAAVGSQALRVGHVPTRVQRPRSD